MLDERRPDDDPLVRYWDDVFQGNHAHPPVLDQGVTDAIHRVHALDDAPAPDQLFVTNLWEEIMHTATRLAPLVPNARVTPNGTATSRPHLTEWPVSHAARPRYRWSALATVVLLVATLGGTFVAFGWPRGDGDDRTAMVATPEAPPPSPETATDPAECQVEPRSDEEVLALWYPASGTPSQNRPARDTRTSIPVPLGEWAGPSIVEGVTATIQETVACINARDIHRFFALLSDDFLGSIGGGTARSFADTSYEDDRAMLAATPAPAPADQRINVIAITNVSLMSDGRVGALFVLDDPSLDPPVQTLLMILVEERGRWVFDEFVEFTGGD